MYSHNAVAQIFNTGNVNAGDITLFGTRSYNSNGGSIDKAELDEDQMSVKTENRLLAYTAAAATIAGGVFLRPSNFPMELLLYTDILFIVAGLAQIFWASPMIKGWGLRDR